MKYLFKIFTNKDQIDLYESFDKIEKYIVQEQKVDINRKFSEYSGEEYKRLQKILDTFDDGWD